MTLSFEAGKVHALCGENGAGKSTLMNIIVGNLAPDSGNIIWKEKGLIIADIQQAQKLGIGIVYQERSLVDSLSVAENIFPDHQPKNRFGLIDYSALYQQTRLLLRQLKLDAISPTTIVGKLSAGQKQMVEIAKALAIRPSLLILDEPTASLTKQETDTLFEIIRHQKNAGVSIIYISHRMDEIRAIADEVSVLKDGMYQGTVDPKTTPTERIIQMMVGRELQQAGYHSNVQKEIRLQVKALSGKGFTNVDFNLYKGEILGVAGLLGSGRTELAQAIFGDVAIDSGAILKDGQEMKIGHPQQAIELGISYIPEERKSLGLFLDKSITENIVAARLQRGMYSEKSNHLTAEALKQQLDIRTPSVRQQVRKLSGGNQQKVVLAKWLNTRPDVLIVNEPTHGVDVGAKAEIYQLLKKLTSEGKSILLISSELTELLLLSDRIAVMHNGSIRDVLTRERATEEKITALASGL